jgi:hypothetical protein
MPFQLIALLTLFAIGTVLLLPRLRPNLKARALVLVGTVYGGTCVSFAALMLRGHSL